MSRFRRLTCALAAAAMLAGGAVSCNRTTKQTAPPEKAQVVTTDGHEAHAEGEPDAKVWRAKTDAKPLSEKTKLGLAWLAKHQLENGGWGQGDESPRMGNGMKQMADKANVADTSMAVLALLRAGNTAAQGAYAKNVRAGIGYILSQIEASDDDSLYVTSVRGTRVQGKIGTYVDTFASLMVLTEAKGTMGSDEENRRLEKGLNKVLAKIEKNQAADGTWGNQGWAPVLTQSIAAKGLNRAAQAGEKVDDETLERVSKQARKQFDASSGRFSGGGSAGVELYAGAAGSSALRDSANTYKTREKALRKKARTSSGADKAEAERQLEEAKVTMQATQSAEEALIARLDDPAFIRGFGNNGGEEFLSYMLMSETLMVEGGERWEQWDAAITKLIHGVQNDDGSWTGHHCITGRTFCTSAALLVLMADRAPIPETAEIAKG